MGEHVVLVGMMGSGKSTIGRIVAERMRRPFYDSDTEVERRTGKSVPEIFAVSGEPTFRVEERAAVCEALASKVPSVIALGGGAVIDPESRRRLRSSGVVIWLDVAPHRLAERLGAGVGRPLLENDASGALARLAAARRPLYREVSDRDVRVESRQPGAVAETVCRAARDKFSHIGVEETT